MMPSRTAMRFRLCALTWHLSASACVLALVLGTLFLGWYYWPGWYLTGAPRVALVMAAVDVVLGPLLTFVIANPAKPRGELARDIAVIVVVQIIALVYGSMALWRGRPLYYTFSSDRLELVQASELDSAEIALGRAQNPDLAPHWYSVPRWVWTPLPENEDEQARIISAAISGGNDVIQMPRYFKPWAQGAGELRRQLKPLEALQVFSQVQKDTLKKRMAQSGLAQNQPITLPLMGREQSLLAVFDGNTLRLRSLLRAD